MKRLRGRSVLFLGIIISILGCSKHASHVVAPDYAKKIARLIAVLPLENQTGDQLAAKMLREKTVEELYFKGYPKIPLDFIDDKLRKSFPPSGSKTVEALNARLGGLLEVDAVLCCTLKEMKTSKYIIYAATSLSLSCELRSTKTAGEILWKAHYGTVKRNFGYKLDLKTSQVYEAAIQEVITKLLQTLPDGPDLIG